MRPTGVGMKQRKVGKDQSLNISNYLMDPNDEGIDEDGNTSVHQLTKNEDFSLFEAHI